MSSSSDLDRLFDLALDMLCVAGFDGFLRATCSNELRASRCRLSAGTSSLSSTSRAGDMEIR